MLNIYFGDLPDEMNEKYIYNTKTRTFEKLPKYIYQRRNGWFEIRKRIGGILLYWGSFPTLEEALLFRAYYIGKNWEVNPHFKNRENGCSKRNYLTFLPHFFFVFTKLFFYKIFYKFKNK